MLTIFRMNFLVHLMNIFELQRENWLLNNFMNMLKILDHFIKNFGFVFIEFSLIFIVFLLLISDCSNESSWKTSNLWCWNKKSLWNDHCQFVVSQLFSSSFRLFPFSSRRTFACEINWTTRWSSIVLHQCELCSRLAEWSSCFHRDTRSIGEYDRRFLPNDLARKCFDSRYDNAFLRKK